MKLTLLTLSMVAVLLTGCCQKATEPISIIPQPNSIIQKAGSYVLTNQNVIGIDNSDLTPLAEYTSQLLRDYSGLDLKVIEGNGPGGIMLNLTDEIKDSEAYILKINDDGINISASTNAGLFYGVQTLRQMIDTVKSSQIEFPIVTIEDTPKFAWRGLHLDVSRHFFPVEDVKRYIDLMSMYKLNRFHWHLTDDQGWRIEIKKYPKLTQVGAWRKNVGFKRNQEAGHNVNDGTPYGGFYTQEQVAEVVEYAKQRGVEVIPEIEIPGHGLAAISAYPELFCFPEQKKEAWCEGGVSDGVYCAGKESTFEILEGVLDEVIAMFPSEYIHVGGDEAPKDGWRKCPLCQKRIKDEGLANEMELQSYVMSRIEKHINAKGRKMIGWDEIMEGGVTKSAAIMSWRGITPGIEAAELGNKVVMAPGKPCYLDHPQSINGVTKASLEAGTNTVRDIYEFNPIPKELHSEYHHNIMGVQGCMWNEGTPDRRILEYRVYPRAIAIAEIGWSAAATSDPSWEEFYARLCRNAKYLEFHKVGYGERSYDVKIDVMPKEGSDTVVFRFTSEVPGSIYYTTSGIDPDSTNSIAYTTPQAIDSSCTIKARMYKPDGTPYRVATQRILFHKALGKTVSYAIPYSSKHDGGGEFAMTNGQTGRWQGFEKRDIDLTVDLGKSTDINRIKTNWWYDIKDWVFRPTEVTYELSEDGQNFEKVFEFTYQTPANVYDKGTMPLVKEFNSAAKARYIRMKAKNIMTNPDWHGSAGAASWIFVDEIVVE